MNAHVINVLFSIGDAAFIAFVRHVLVANEQALVAQSKGLARRPWVLRVLVHSSEVMVLVLVVAACVNAFQALHISSSG